MPASQSFACYTEQLCRTCRAKVRRAEHELETYVPRNAGVNQHSPLKRWKTYLVTELQYKILRQLQAATTPLSNRDLRRKVYGAFDPLIDQDHALRQQIWKLRKVLTDWEISRTSAGYKLTSKE